MVEKKRRMIMKRFLLEEMKKREGKGNNIWMSIFFTEEKKKREGKRGKCVLLETIQIISIFIPKCTVRGGGSTGLGIVKKKTMFLVLP